MEEKLKLLYGALEKIKTKGIDTLIMADCLRFLGQCIQECNIEPSTEPLPQQKEEKEE